MHPFVEQMVEVLECVDENGTCNAGSSSGWQLNAFLKTTILALEQRLVLNGVRLSIE